MKTRALSSHSLKATTLSWASKAEVPREHRRILGRHSSAVQCADSYYSRDMSIGPVNALQKVIEMIRAGTFQPDASRSNYFPTAVGPAAGTPAHVVMQPFTPAFLETQPTGDTCAHGSDANEGQWTAGHSRDFDALGWRCQV